MRYALLPLVLLALGSCGGRSYLEIVEEATPCVEGDTCVIAGVSSCSCGSAVNAKRAQEVNEAAAHENCGGTQAICRACTPQCFTKEGLCGCF